MPKLILEGCIVVPEPDLLAVEQAIDEHIELTRNEPGCLVFRLTRDQQNRNVFAVYEEFIDRDAFDAHQARIRASRWGAVARNVERHYRIREADD